MEAPKRPLNPFVAVRSVRDVPEGTICACLGHRLEPEAHSPADTDSIVSRKNNVFQNEPPSQ